MENEIKFPCSFTASLVWLEQLKKFQKKMLNIILAGRLSELASQLTLAKARAKKNFHSVHGFSNFRP